MEAYLEQVSDQVLSSEAGLLRLYAVKGPLTGALSGCSEAIHLETGVRYAMRPTSVKELSASRRKRDELHAMVQAMRRLVSTGGAGAPGGDASTSSPLPQLHEVVATPSRILVFFELEPLLRRDGGMITDLLSLLEKRNRLREEEARAIFVRLVLATKAAHELGVALRNIKPEGVQVSQRVKGEPWRLHLVDLHCAAIVDDTDEQHGGLSGLHGTPEYAAPEVALWYWHESGTYRDANGKPAPPPLYGLKADVWSLGMCLHVMLCGCFPFETRGRPVDAVLRDVNAADFTFDDPGWSKLSPPALEMVRLLLCRDSRERPVLEEVLQHQFCGAALQEAVPCTRDDSLKDSDYDKALAALDSDGD